VTSDRPPPPEETRQLASELVAWSTATGRGNAAVAADRLLRALGEELERLVGRCGAGLLVRRAVQHAAAHAPLLERLELPAKDFPVNILGHVADGACEPEIREAAEAVIAELFALLGRFFGARLTRQVLRRAFPGVPATITEVLERIASNG
jgi:hypothetical protein